jgi:hypothetical protein
VAGRLLARDLAALTTIGIFRMPTRVQLKAWHFERVSETVVRRFIDRMVERGYLGQERINRNGVQVVWLTQAGTDLLVDQAGVSRTDLFPAHGPVAARDFAHTTAIGDVALAVARRGFRSDVMLPAWAVGAFPNCLKHIDYAADLYALLHQLAWARNNERQLVATGEACQAYLA